MHPYIEEINGLVLVFVLGCLHLEGSLPAACFGTTLDQQLLPVWAHPLLCQDVKEHKPPRRGSPPACWWTLGSNPPLPHPQPPRGWPGAWPLHGTFPGSRSASPAPRDDKRQLKQDGTVTHSERHFTDLNISLHSTRGHNHSIVCILFFAFFSSFFKCVYYIVDGA